VHGIVGNGWFFRQLGEVRFWQQANALLEAEPFYATARREARLRGRSFRCAKLFWWFNQGARVDYSVTPKPYYGADGRKAFGIYGTPAGLTERLEAKLGRFPFASFWGPQAGLASSEWIAHCGAEILKSEMPDLLLVYLPHLDYDLQRLGPGGCDVAKLTRELDAAAAMLIDSAVSVGARIWIVSEYGHCDVSRVIEPNRALRRAGLLAVRHGPFGENLDVFASRAFAVCDHQLAHVYVRETEDLPRVRDVLAGLPGIDRILDRQEKADLKLDHQRSGDLVALSKRDSWFAYPFWLEECSAPDYARTVDIHRKPGFDPCELLFDPALRFPQGRAAWRLAQNKLGFRALFDIVPMDPRWVRGSHGLRAALPEDRPILIGDGPRPASWGGKMENVRDLILIALDLLPHGL
jgi:predicted AlkP superfamily pyrophosphatase or phosphodiesterase